MCVRERERERACEYDRARVRFIVCLCVCVCVCVHVSCYLTSSREKQVSTSHLCEYVYLFYVIISVRFVCVKERESVCVCV